MSSLKDTELLARGLAEDLHFELHFRYQGRPYDEVGEELLAYIHTWMEQVKKVVYLDISNVTLTVDNKPEVITMIVDLWYAKFVGSKMTMRMTLRTQTKEDG